MGKGNWTADREAFRGGLELSDSGPLAEQFARLTKALLNAPTVADVLDQVVTAAHRVVPGADLVSITLRTADGIFHTPVTTSEVAIELDRIQYETGEGPCVEAARNPGPAQVRSDDMGIEPAWPRFGPEAARRDVHSVLSVALMPDARPPRYSGALNIYSRRRGALAPDAHEPALLLATHASLALAGTASVTRADLTAAQLRRAIESRDVIGQAKGILMARRGISADDAFDELRRASQNLNIKLTDVARILTARPTDLDLAGALGLADTDD
ncbi:GAF and ANTAR domain-containing protein [Lentzea sp. PSKA42]|uniref:GAF and ANTAR domain-containing protein n=1 Tax=Lentzea indica TaxID=2604800 RepID=A0ABX1FMZ9_9PSEU|nr:GAF and ANTAR domain-containing protein [Lentzea indica]NKE60370.1 GAF and ANTAR domain-containing protein [Lentzea indica]